MQDKQARRESREAAATAGRVKYLSDSPCGTCRRTLRYTSSSTCVHCAKRRAKAKHEKFKALLAQANQG